MTTDRRAPDRPVVLAILTVFTVLTCAGVGGVWWWWGVGFDEAERLGVATAATDRGLIVSAWLAVSGLAGLFGTVLVTYLTAQTSRTIPRSSR